VVIQSHPQLEAVFERTARGAAIAPEWCHWTPCGNGPAHRSAHVSPRDEWERKLFGAAIDCGRVHSGLGPEQRRLYE